jgi:hypothetical protein
MPSTTNLSCETDPRRDAVRATDRLNGLDYVEVGDDQRTLYVYFLGKLPPELRRETPDLARYLRLDGGDRITGIGIVDVDPAVSTDPERDDWLVVRLDRIGDFSPYTVRLVGVADIDPRYDSARFHFRIDCASDLDCAQSCRCAPDVMDEPRINYLAKDYESFRQLILDRLSVLMPTWTERHVPDIGITMVELLAYVGDYLSYYQDAVATEAYLSTARQRISVRRHARLVDYRLHEGCNSRAWVQLAVSSDVPLPLLRMAFITGHNNAIGTQPSIIATDQLAAIPPSSIEYFEPMAEGAASTVNLRRAHNEIHFYTWGNRECCLLKGSTRATLVDHWTPGERSGYSDGRQRALAIRPGDVLIFEEVLGARSGLPVDADPKRRHAVRVTAVQPIDDPLYSVPVGGEAEPATLPTPLLEISWAATDALPFTLCISAIGSAPECAYISNISLARGNVILVDHGRTGDPEPLPAVPGLGSEPCCECEGHPSDVQISAGPYRPTLLRPSLTFAQPIPTGYPPASQMLSQDPRTAVPQVVLTDGNTRWIPRQDLLASGPDDPNFVVEIDNSEIAHLRFGDGLLGRSPTVGGSFSAVYRNGRGTAGNVGAESISHLVLDDTAIDGVSVTVRNPLPALGGVDPEPIRLAKLLAPRGFRQPIERAIIADDYARIAERNPGLQRASAELLWTGSWYEADVAIDALGTESAEPVMLRFIEGMLYRYRRIGHDLRVQAADHVPILLRLEICVLPRYDGGHVKAALISRFSNRVNSDGSTGFFHPDAVSFGQDIYLSRIIAAAQSVVGVASATVVAFHRCLEEPNQEIANGVLPLACNEIAQLDNDPDHPERGGLHIVVRGGR